MVNKISERKRLSLILEKLNPNYRQLAEQKINERLEKFLASHEPQGIGIYLNRADEVSTKQLYDWLLAKGWTVYAPKIEGENLNFYQLKQEPDEIFWRKKFQIWEPNSNNPKAKNFSIIIVPLVGYSKNNYRLGRGGGYYDRWLQANHPQLAIGLAYKEQVVNHKLAFNSMDYPLNLIITNDE